MVCSWWRWKNLTLLTYPYSWWFDEPFEVYRGNVWDHLLRGNNIWAYVGGVEDWSPDGRWEASVGESCGNHSCELYERGPVVIWIYKRNDAGWFGFTGVRTDGPADHSPRWRP